MKTPKKRVRYTENAIPSLARKATKAAFKRSLNSGNGAVVRQGNSMVRIDKDGGVTVIKQLPPLITVKKGSRYTING